MAEGLAPLKGWVKRLVDHVIQGCIGAADLEFAWSEPRAADPGEQAKMLDLCVRGGICTINETQRAKPRRLRWHHIQFPQARVTRMRFYWPIAKIDAEQRMVWGYASTEALDDHGESIKREALAAALDDYMRFANIREMHQLSAVGVAREAAVDRKGLYLAAKIVDDEAWEKVVEGVYKGFSIGGRITARDPADRKIITGLKLTEISVVDRPANPEAVFDCWKQAAEPPAPEIDTDRLADLIGELAWLLDCLAAAGAGEETDGGGDVAAIGHAGTLRKRHSADRIAPLAKSLVELADMVMPRLDTLQKRVEDIARTPLPPQTVARGYVGIGKREDGAAFAPAADDIVAALARMSEEERTLTLIKAAHATPIQR